MRSTAVALVLALAGGVGGAVADAKSEAVGILERAIANQRDGKALETALADLDKLIAKNPRDPDAHYSRGWVLSRAGKNEEAVAAYDRALELDARLVTAPYNAGVVLGRMGNLKGAAVRFERALKIDPKHVDAAYNAGQTYYDLKDYDKAAARWEQAMKLSPDDFQIAKRLVQAYVALGSKPRVATARDRVFAMWRSGRDSEKSKSYLYDQFAVGKLVVSVYETFEPAGDPAIVFQAKVSAGDKLVGTINLEGTKDGYGVAIDKGGERTAFTDPSWKKLPEYKAFKTAATKLAGERF